jgi:hypothetical protein
VQGGGARVAALDGLSSGSPVGILQDAGFTRAWLAGMHLVRLALLPRAGKLFIEEGPPVSYETDDRANLKAWQTAVRAEATW